jgi:small subunit ribosomal protein S6
MFLVDVAKASSDWDGVISAITKILERSEAEILSMKKWDDRKLAYDIKGQSRGVYILCYFKVDGTRIQEIEKNMRLSEQVMRLLILNAELMTQEDIDKETPADKAETEDVKVTEETSETETAKSEAETAKEEAPQEKVEDSEAQEPEQESQEEDESKSETETESDEEKQA